jgi:Zn-dependent alcohol dehydrogenases
METNEVKAYGTEALNVPLHSMIIKRRELQPHDVEMEILYCGICHSDLHQIKNDFGHTMFPIVPGHEIVGKVTGVGEHVKKFKVGDLAAVGCIVDSCGKCEYCEDDLEQFCDEGVTFSFNSPDKYLGGATLGGFQKPMYATRDMYLVYPKNLI